MIPKIIISKNKREVNKYLNQFIKAKGFDKYYVYKIVPEKTKIVIDQIKSIQNQIIVEPKKTRLFIISSFDTATIEAQNAFLKTLEEKNLNNHFILLVQNQESIIQTVKSRCKTIDLDKRTLDFEINSEVDDLLKNVYKDKKHGVLQNKIVSPMSSLKAKKLLDQIIFYFFRKIKKEKKSFDIKILKKCFYLKNLLDNNNLNPQLTIDSLLIFIKKTYRINSESKN